MTPLRTTDIHWLRLSPLPAPDLWRLMFHSAHTTLHHQLYVNGQLVDYTQRVEQRSFLVTQIGVPQELCVVAVPADRRTTDYRNELPEAQQSPPWIHHFRVARDLSHVPLAQLRVGHDHATGTIDPDTEQRAAIWLDASEHWGFGLGEFGAGGWGVDGDLARGLGLGEFGTGPFGFGGTSLTIELVLAEQGVHQIELTVETPDGATSPATLATVRAVPPPLPADSLLASLYDTSTETLTLVVSHS
jgi:hypothetical protein